MASLVFGILIGMSANFYHAGLFFSGGAHRAKVPHRFCWITALVCVVTCTLGYETAVRIGSVIPAETHHILGSFIWIAVGLWSLVQAFPWNGEALESHTTLGFSEMMFIGLAHGLAGICIGFGAGFSNLSAVCLVGCTGLSSFVCLRVPSRIGRRFEVQKLSKSAAVLSSVLLVAAAVWL